MRHKKPGSTRLVFAFGVPITVLSFYLGFLSLPVDWNSDLMRITIWDGLAIFISFIGTLMYNMVEEPLQRISEEKMT